MRLHGCFGDEQEDGGAGSSKGRGMRNGGKERGREGERGRTHGTSFGGGWQQ